MTSTSQQNVRESSEVEAWKVMMDSMTKFISASTKLMQTITNRLETNAAAIQSPNLGKCDEDCVVCPTRSPKECNECSAALAKSDRKKSVEVSPPDKAATSSASTATASASTTPAGTTTDKTATDSTGTDPAVPPDSEAEKTKKQAEADVKGCECLEILQLKKANGKKCTPKTDDKADEKRELNGNVFRLFNKLSCVQ